MLSLAQKGAIITLLYSNFNPSVMVSIFLSLYLESRLFSISLDVRENLFTHILFNMCMYMYIYIQ